MSSCMSLSIDASSSSSSSSRNWVYDVFPSFSGADVRVAFLSHFLKELDRKFIIAFKDSEIERSRSLDPELKQAIKDSRIAVVVFSNKYTSSSWCLNELLEIVKCKEEFGQMVIPIFYGLDPSHVRKQTGDFGKFFEETCRNKTDELKLQWREALTDVANILGYHSMTWGNEAKMIEAIINDILDKLLLTPSKDFEEFVGIEDHFAQMSESLQLESEEVRMIGIWGSTGIGKTTIARALFNRLSRHFQGNIYIDGSFVSKSMQNYRRANPDDYNMKLDLQRNFLSDFLGKRDIQINHLGAVEGRLNHRKVLIVIDDLDDQVVLDVLVGKTEWFGCGSRIIVVTKDKQFLRAHDIEHIYEVCLPSTKQALEMFSRYAFKRNSPPDGFMEVASEVVLRAGNLPLGLNVLGSYLRGRCKEDWMDMLPSLVSRLNGKVERTLRVSYDGLNNKNDAALFRHIASLFNGEKVDEMKLLLADSKLDVNIGFKNLVDKSLIDERWYKCNTVEMHYLLQEMGKEIVRAQSKEPGEREFLTDSEDICDLFQDNSGTKKVLGIALAMYEIEELHMHESSFKGMRNLLFLKIDSRYDYRRKKVRLPESFDYFPPKLRLLSWDDCPLSCLPSNFPLENLVKLRLGGSQLEKLWEGVHPLPKLRTMDLAWSVNLKEIPDLSMATNLETLYLCSCQSLVELPSSIQYLNKLTGLDMHGCTKLENLPTGINLKSLDRLDLRDCSRLKMFPDISRNISFLDLSTTGIEEVPWWIEKFSRLGTILMDDCDNLQRASLNLLKLKHLECVIFTNCGALAEGSFNDSPMGTDNILSNFQVPADEASSHDDFRVVMLDFKKCFNFDPKALIQQQIVFMQLIMPGEEVPLYFTHRTTGTSFNNIPLCQASLSQRIFRFRGCAVVDVESIASLFTSFEIRVCCRFIDRDGNQFDSIHNAKDLSTSWIGDHLVIFDCRFPLAEQLNNGHVDIKFHLTGEYKYPKSELKGCGIKLLQDDRHVNPEDWEESDDITVERSKSRKPNRIVKVLLIISAILLYAILCRCFQLN